MKRDKTIRTIPHDRCTGCGACYNTCPKSAITMQFDEEGFLFPTVNDACVNCGQCVNVCPAEHPLQHYPTPQSYAVWADADVRLKSSSGGMFSILADYVFANGGVVCGAAYTDDFLSVYHTWAENREELAPLRSSKYVQSDTKLTYRQAKAYLDAGRMVLYSGCPCQIAGLYNYLGGDRDGLITADLVCHGSNSVFAFQSFVKEYADGKEIEKLDFRDKVQYSWSTPTVMYFKDGTLKKSAWNEGFWYKGFLEGVINRECCYQCPYARAERIADFTMGDCWQVSRINPAYDDRKGTSLVLPNSPKGKELFAKLAPQMSLCAPIDLQEIRKYNGQLNQPTKKHPSRKFFFSHLKDYGYHKALWYGRGMRYDVGIVGWWFASNYGSSLTYYALCTVLEEMNRQVLLIPIGKPNGTPWEPEIQQTIDFLKRYFHTGRNRSFGDMAEFNKFCDAFMLGSDQMWTPATLNLVGYTFFLDFVEKNKRKIAFSTSFGHGDFIADKEILETAGDYLRRFTAVSVRENSGVEVCRKRFGVEAEQIFDPVFMCSKEKYDMLADSVSDPLPKKYLLCYILDPTPEKEQAAKAIAEKKGYEILTILGMKEYKYAVDKWHTGTVLPKVSAEQFLYYIKHADYVMTDSHHGTCFSIIYHRPYAALVNVNRGKTRFVTVAETLGLMDRLVEDPLEIKHNRQLFKSINYDKVDAIIEREKERAYRWLNTALTTPPKENSDTPRTIVADMYRQNHRKIMHALWSKQIAEDRLKQTLEQLRMLETKLNEEGVESQELKEIQKSVQSSIDEVSKLRIDVL